MITASVIAGVTCVSLFLTVFFLPRKKIGRSPFSVYSVVPLVGAILLCVFGCVSVKEVVSYFFTDSVANPVKIIILFISMSFLSVYLDETGFFGYVACVAVRKTGGVQFRILLTFYLVCSVLTVFTSNDIVILTFTPFICQFCKRCRIDPVPYVFSAFVAANTWSILLMIGNPTNVFIAQSNGIDFFGYLKTSWLPTVFAGVISFFVLLAVFGSKLKLKADPVTEEPILQEKVFTVIGLVFLVACTVCLAVLPYFGVEMYYVAAAFCLALVVTVSAVRLFKRQKPTIVVNTVKRSPFEMIPLVLGMAVVALALDRNGVTAAVAKAVGTDNAILKYGVLSTVTSNLLNNIPMSIIFSDILSDLSGVVLQKAAYSTIIGSNIGAFLSPLGALAGLMFTAILARHEVKFSFVDFLKHGLIVAPLTLFAALLGLYIVL